MSFTISGARLIGAGGVDAGSVTPVDRRIRVQQLVVYTVRADSTAEVSRPEFHKLLWGLRFGIDGRLTHLGQVAFRHLQAKGLAPKFTAKKPIPHMPPGPPKTGNPHGSPGPLGPTKVIKEGTSRGPLGPSKRTAKRASEVPAEQRPSKRAASGSSNKTSLASVCSHVEPGDLPCASCESYQLGFRTVAVVKSWGESARALVRDLDRGILCILGLFRLEAAGMNTEFANLWAAGFQMLSPTQLALSGIDAATMTHVATAAYTDRNVPLFNALRQALACFGRIVTQPTWQALVMSGAVEVPIRELQKLPRGVSLDAPDNASRFSLVGAPDDTDGTRVAVVLPDVLSAIRGLAIRANQVFVSIVAGGLVPGPSGAKVAFPTTYVPPSPGTPDDTDTVIRGAETLSWSILTQVLQTAPPEGRILFEGCYYVPEGLRPGQVPFLYLFSLAIRRDFIRPNPEIQYARYNGQYLLPPGTAPKRTAVLFKAIRKLRDRFQEGVLDPIENNLDQLRKAMPLIQRAAVSAFPGAPRSQSEPEESGPQLE